MKRLFYITVLALFASPGHLIAQSIDYELLLWAGGGPAGLHYTPAGGKANIRTGFQAGAGYAFFPHKKWGIVAGVELASYRTNVSLFDNITIASPSVNITTGEEFEWHVRLTGFEEKQTAYMLNVPIKLQFQSSRKSDLNFYARVGAKINFLRPLRYTTSTKTLTTSGYFPSRGEEIRDVPSDGFGTLMNWSDQGAFTLRIPFSASAEVGIIYNLPDDLRLYIGAYFDYGYNNVKRDEVHNNIFPYFPGPLTPYRHGNSVLNVRTVVDHINLVALGVKASLAFGRTIEPKKKVRYYRCRCGQ